MYLTLIKAKPCAVILSEYRKADDMALGTSQLPEIIRRESSPRGTHCDVSSVRLQRICVGHSVVRFSGGPLMKRLSWMYSWCCSRPWETLQSSLDNYYNQKN